MADPIAAGASKAADRTHTVPVGVYYRANDYIGFGRRVVIFAVDFTVLLIALISHTFFLALIGVQSPVAHLLVGMLIVWCYLVPIKRSKFRTLGYRLMHCQLVNLQGEPPPLWAITLRTLLWFFGPACFVFDFIWCGIDGDRQTLRDRYAGTCLIRNDAQPLGSGEIHLTRYFALGYVHFYPHVVHESLPT